MNSPGSFLVLMFIGFFLLVSSSALADEKLALAGERLSKTCAGCHGTGGASPGKLIPIIGGQKSGYLATVMKEFALDQRPGSVMANLAKGYPETDQKQIAAFFASKPWVNTLHIPADAPKGTAMKSCQGCHGKDGYGRGSFPRIAGQHPEYLYDALLEYKDGSRKAATMGMTKRIDDVDLKYLANYYSTLK